MKRREVPLDELRKRPAVTVTEATQLTGYCRISIYARIADKTYRSYKLGDRHMIVTRSLWEAEERLAEAAS